MMHWIYSAFVGLVVGALARFFLPGADSMGWIMTCLVGVGGSFLGTAIGHGTGMIQKNAGAGWILSILGAIVILVGIRMI